MVMTWTQHPSVITGDNLKPCLRVFKYLKADPTLSKHLVNGKVVLNGSKPMTIEEYMNNADGMSLYRRNNDVYIPKREKWYARILRWFHAKINRKGIPPETFDEVKSLLGERIISSDIEVAAVKLKELIAKTRVNGQVALSKRLETEYQNVLNEIVLVKNGLFHYLDEDDVVKLLQKADFGIRIDFWNDYPDFIPDDVLEAKRNADSLCVFDNWCIMHYDPKGEALKQIKTEEWRRDPILFGMIVGSDRLYYVKDWETEKDHLTIDKVCKMLGIKNIREARDYGSGIDSIIMNMDTESNMIIYNATEPSEPEEVLPRDMLLDARNLE